MAITNQDRVGKAMELLRAGLAPFVERVAPRERVVERHQYQRNVAAEIVDVDVGHVRSPVPCQARRRDRKFAKRLIASRRSSSFGRKTMRR